MKPAVYYWDSSAVLSTLIEDVHSPKAHQSLQRRALHLVTTLVQAEVIAVLNRIRRLEKRQSAAINKLEDRFLHGPWQLCLIQPDLAAIVHISKQSPLRGADLWHAAAYHTLRETHIPIQMITFDQALNDAMDRLIATEH